MSATKAYHSNWLCSRQPYVVSLNITESALFADFVKQLKNATCFHGYIKLNNMEGEKNATPIIFLI